MARYSGKDLHIIWQYSGGTVELNTDYRSLEESEEMQTADSTAGPDEVVTEQPIRVEPSVSVELLDNDSSAGQAIWAALAPGTSGTLVWSPRGTAMGMPKREFPCYVKSRSRPFAHDDITSISVEFGALGPITDGTW